MYIEGYLLRTIRRTLQDKNLLIFVLQHHKSLSKNQNRRQNECHVIILLIQLATDLFSGMIPL